MLIGQSLLATSTTATLYGPWMPRAGDEMLAVVRVLRTSGSGIALTCAVQTKNREDVDPSGDIGTVSVTTTTGAVTTMKAAGCKELVRYRYTLSSETTEWIHFEPQAPVWVRN